MWRRSVSNVPLAEVDPVVQAKFLISPTDRVATAGSCFAQHISRHLSQSGFNYLVTEPGHPIVSPDVRAQFNYGVYTARYGNLYTARQLLQTLRRAYGLFQPVDEYWSAPDGRLIDPLRPQIQPDGFATIEELRFDRVTHFRAIRQAIETMDVLVFTLGLTETWLNVDDGAVYPLCPGVSGGHFDSTKHLFHNLSVVEVVDDLHHAFDFIRSRNQTAKFILTVSPVPLIATMEPRSVLASTTYSKAVLRVAAEQVANELDRVAYFPSFEVITGNFNRGQYFAQDLRTVTEAGVAHVMRLFMKHYADSNVPAPVAITQSNAESGENVHAIERILRVVCEEEALDDELALPVDQEGANSLDEIRLLLQRQEWTNVVQECRRLRTASPQIADAYVFEGTALHLIRRFDEARCLLNAAEALFPNDARIPAQLTEIELKELRYSCAMNRAEQLRSRFPSDGAGFLLGIEALMGLGDYEGAESLAARALVRFPGDFGLLFRYAIVPVAQRQWGVAVSRLADLRSKFPDQAEGYIYGLIALREAGELESANRLGTAAMDKFPHNVDVAEQTAWIATRLEDWNSAADRWEGVRRLDASRSAATVQSAIALQKCGRNAEPDEWQKEGDVQVAKRA
jgi:tetratricopeptide (TPR) repeat protein